MEKFCQHIEKLLAQHEYVVVPDLGGFVIQMQSASILPDRIIPPLATIGFNPLMHHADGLLAIEISRSQQISYRLAMEYIDKEVESIKIRLNATGKTRLGNLGILQKDELGNLLFQPLDKVDFLPQNLGLTDLYISYRGENSEEEQRKITFTLPSTNLFKYVAAAMLIFGLFFVSNRVSDVRHTDSANLASLSFVNSPDILPDSTPVITEPIEIIAVEIKAEEICNFHVVVASLPNQKSADKYCKTLLEDKFLEAHVLTPVKTYRVAIQSFADRDEAIQYMENLRLTGRRFENAWVHCNN